MASKNGQSHCFSQYVHVVVAGGTEGQLAVVGEEEGGFNTVFLQLLAVERVRGSYSG